MITRQKGSESVNQYVLQNSWRGIPMERHSHDVYNRPRGFVAVPDGLYCLSCYDFHGYPSHELSEKESTNFLLLLEKCPNCCCARIEYPRQYLLEPYDQMNEHFTKLNRKFDSIEDLIMTIRYFDEESWKLVREVDTRKETTTTGPVLEMLMELPEGILEDYKISFREFLKKLYKERIGFVKGKYLVISTELLFRQCEGDKIMFLEVLSEAYSLVESRYCSISRLAIEEGFWQVCPEFGGFFWRNNNLENEFPFLRKFLQNKTVFVKNFSLSMGPYYLIGAGYFSYIHNVAGNLVLWHIPNFWQEGFTHQEKACFYNAQNFWYGWYGDRRSKYGSPYYGVTLNECDYDMLDYFPTAINNYYK